MKVAVSWAGPETQFELSVELPEGSCIADALQLARAQLTDSDIAWSSCIDWQGAAVGIFGETRDRQAPLREADRVEIYRPLLIDPKEGRRARAKRLRA
jgi:uncharacterized protein